MFNDHLIFSNNIYDAANKLHQIQEANVRSAADLQALGREVGEDAKRKAQIEAYGRRASNTEADIAGNEAYMRASRPYSQRAGSRSFKLGKLYDILPHLARAGDHETLAAVTRVLNDANMSPTVENKRAGAKDYRDDGVLQDIFDKGGRATPPASQADLRLAVSIMRDKYQIPWQEQPKDMTPDAFDSFDKNNKGRTEEVAAAAKLAQVLPIKK